jgi:hypothetical protein
LGIYNRSPKQLEARHFDKSSPTQKARPACAFPP